VLGLVAMPERIWVTFNCISALRYLEQVTFALTFAVRAQRPRGDDVVGRLVARSGDLLGATQLLEALDRGVGHVDALETRVTWR